MITRFGKSVLVSDGFRSVLVGFGFCVWSLLLFGKSVGYRNLVTYMILAQSLYFAGCPAFLTQRAA